jgi:mRNA interferase MazF
MKQPGQVVLFRFPQTDLVQGKLRPALLVAPLPGDYGDWLICMISSHTRQYIPGFDELVQETDDDFGQTGLHVASLIRVGRLAAVDGGILVGAIGQLVPDRLQRIKERLANWITAS